MKRRSTPGPMRTPRALVTSVSIVFLHALTVLCLVACGSGTYEVRTPLRHSLVGRTVTVDVRGRESFLEIEKGRSEYARWMRPHLVRELQQRGIQVVSSPRKDLPRLSVELFGFDQGKFGTDGRCELDVRLTSSARREPLADMTVRIIATRRGNHDKRTLGKVAVLKCAEAVARYLAPRQ